MFSMFDFFGPAGCWLQAACSHETMFQSVSQTNRDARVDEIYCRNAPRFRSGVTLEPGGNTCHVACHPKDDEHAVAPEASRGMV
jgi:hypothetical protein